MKRTFTTRAAVPFYAQGRLLIVIGVALVLSAGPAGAVSTPYSDDPAAVWTYTAGGGSLVWDTQFAGWFDTSGNGQFEEVKCDVVAVYDFCHSGGFLDQLSFAKYAATSCDWDEHALTSALFGKKFMTAAKGGATMSDSFTAAYTAGVVDVQLPLERNNTGGGIKLDYTAGDRAILFSGLGDQPEFWEGIKSAHDALVGYSGAGSNWAGQEASITALHADGTAPEAAPWLDGAATAANLKTAVQDAVNTMTAGQTLFLYFDDHGASTDVIKSRHVGNQYLYETTVSIWRPDDYDSDAADDPYIYGITDLYVRGYVLDGYSDWSDPKPGWTHNVYKDTSGRIWIHWFSTDKNDPDTWLESGVDYGFGFRHDGKPVKTYWDNMRYGGHLSAGLKNRGIHDWGSPIGGPMGRGKQVFEKPASPDADPAQWPGWDNGGDGWVWAPIPEPLTLLGVLLAAGAVMHYIRKTRV